MLSREQLLEIQSRLATQTEEGSAPASSDIAIDQMRRDAQALYSEVERLTRFVVDFSGEVTSKLETLERDMLTLEAENARLRSVTQSTYFERDACVGLISQMAILLGHPAGTGRFNVAEQNGTQAQNRVIVDLPSGQVSWEFLEEDAHLFQSLPQYEGQFVDQTIRDIYSKVMSPGLNGTTTN